VGGGHHPAFIGYTSGLSHNPPGFYIDESAIAYNAYLVSRTGAGESGTRFPLYFQMFSEGFTQYVSPTQVYLLALVFRFVPPSILAARIFSADPDRDRLYASSAHMNSVLVFDLQGNRIGTLASTPPDKLDGPSALALAKDKLFVLNAASARVSLINLQNR
jgi:DNA-binding beta-propeller fold protein YncE